MAAPRRLGGWVVALIVLDVVLVGILVTLFVTAPSGAGEEEPSAAPSSSAPSEPETSASTTPAPAVTPPDGALDLTAFALPSRNIWCELSAQEATCRIAEFDFSPPATEDCEGTVGHVLSVTEERASFPCSTEDVPPAASDDIPVLEYGTATATAGHLCTSETDGVTCIAMATGRGFTLARDGFTLF